MVKSRRRAASSIDMSGSPVTTKPRCPRPAFESRRGSETSIVAELVDLKALADRFDAAEGFEQRPQAIAGDAEHLEVDVGRLVTGAEQQAIAHPAADDERAAAGVADGGGDRDRLFQCVLIARLKPPTRALSSWTAEPSPRQATCDRDLS